MSAGSSSLIFRRSSFGRERRVEVEVRDLRERVHAGVGAAGPVQLELRATRRRRDRAVDLALHRARVLLDLPAAVARAGILDEEFEARHGSGERRHRRAPVPTATFAPLRRRTPSGRSAAAASRPGRSSRSDGWRRARRRCRRGSTRGTGRSLRQCGSLWKRSSAPATGRRPAASCRKTRVSRCESSVATSCRVMKHAGSGRALHLELVAEVMVKLLQGFDSRKLTGNQTVRASWSCRRTGRSMIQPARSRRGGRRPSTCSTYGCSRWNRESARMPYGERNSFSSSMTSAPASAARDRRSTSSRRSDSPCVRMQATLSVRSGRWATNHSSRFLKAGRRSSSSRLERLDGEQRNQARPSSAPSSGTWSPDGAWRTS